MRIAWFSPFPPVRTGVAACSAGLVPALARRGHVIDPYTADSAHDFPWRHAQQPYDLIVYQFGNASHHDYAWAYATRYPGLVVLHDTHLHHARAAFLLRERRVDDYRAEFRRSDPQLSPDLAELAIAGFDNRLYYEWPMVTSLIESARLVAVHGAGARAELLSRLPESRRSQFADDVIAIRLGHGEEVSPSARAEARRRIDARYGLAAGTILFGSVGGLTRDKRIPQVLAALQAILPQASAARLLLAGAPAPDYDVRADVAARGLADRVTITGYLDSDAELTTHLAACDASLNLRWPTAGETSGPWLRALAAGVPSVITDLVHLGDVPSLDPRTWQVNAQGGDASERPVCIAIDILDEDHSLRAAMRRLATDAALRDALGRAGQQYWRQHHAPAAMVEDYERIIAMAAARPDPPATFRPDGQGTLRALLQPFGMDAPW